jgi:flagellar hook-associated protein 2
MLLAAGADSKVQIDGVTYQRTTNKIDDLISGVTLDLKNANASTTVTVNVDYDYAGIKEKIKTFVNAYNTVLGSIKTNFTYDSETKKPGGPLFDDVTLQTVKSTLTNVVGQQVTAAGSYSTFGLAGINIDKTGTLSIDDAKLTAALQNSFDSVTSLFAVKGSSTAASLQYVSHGRKTVAGTYAVSITTAATRGAVTGTSNLDDGDGLDGNDTLTITDTATGRIATVALTSGMNGNAVVAAINSELAKNYQQVITGSQNNTKTSGAGGGVITASTTFAQINTGSDANNVTNNDTISFSGTTRSGKAVSGTFTITDKSTKTIQDFLNAIETAYGTGVKASIDSNGAIVLTDLTAGTSQLTLSITANNQGGGSLTFGTQSVSTTGRYAMEITASKETGGFLKLTHNSYGSANGFTISQSANHLGMSDASFSGVDVDGTINGQAATGSGQTLTGDADAVSVEGMVITYTGTSTGSIGNVTVDFGIMEQMERALYNVTDQAAGSFRYTEDTLKNNIKRADATIDRMERRLILQKERLVRQFIAMENAISRIKAQSIAFGAPQ